jgi:subtilisin family serine protease
VIAQVDAGQLDRIRADGFQVVAERPLSAGRGSLLRVTPPSRLSTSRALARLREIAPGRAVDRNTIYTQRFQIQGARPSSRKVFGDPLAAVDWKSPESCRSFAAIGMIDTGIDASHPGLRGKALETRVLRSPNREPSSPRHGTAVANLLLGDGRFPGLAEHARVIAIDAFHSKEGVDQVDTFDLVAAMDALKELGVAVINLSLAGNANEVLDAEGRHARAQGIIVVAASGNDGAAAKPRYPAAYDWAVAVTAIDQDRNIYRRAVRGPHIRLAAPGVGIVLDDGKGQPRQHTGTSFAAPFVSARMALARSEERAEIKPSVTGAPVDAARPRQAGSGIEPLLAQAIDLGTPGRDNEFGNGLVQFGETCVSRAR